MPLGDLTRALILARQLHSMAFVTLLSDSNHVGNPSRTPGRPSALRLLLLDTAVLLQAVAHDTTSCVIEREDPL